MTRLWRRFRLDILLLAGLALLPFFLYWDVSAGGKTMLPADNLFQWQPWASYADEFGAERPHNHLISDLILQNYAWKNFIRENVAAGAIPLWNPNLFAGIPFLAAGQHGGYYPFSVLFLIMPLAKAYGWYTISQLWLAGALAYLWGRTLGWRRGGAFIVGLIYQGCGFMLVSAAVFPMIIGAAAWLPALLAAIELIIGRTWDEFAGSATLPFAVLGAVALGSQILAGHIEISYYTLLTMALYALWRLGWNSWRGRRQDGALLRQRILRSIGWLAGMVGIGMMLGAIQFIPFLQVGQSNFREGSASLAEVRDYGYKPRRILTLLLPNFYGNPTHHHYRDLFNGESTPFALNAYGEPNPQGAGSSDWGTKNYVEGGIYLGVLTLALAGLGAWSAGIYPARRPQILFFAGLALLSLAFIFGTPLYALLYYGLPGINQLHSPFRWVFPFSLAMATLAGYGVDYLSLTGAPARENRGGRLAKLFFLGGRKDVTSGLAGILAWGGIFALLGLFGSRLLYGKLELTIERLFMGLALAPTAFPHVRAFYSYQFWQLAILACMLLGSGIVLRVSRSPINWRGAPGWFLLGAILVGVDLGIATGDFNAAVDPDLLTVQPALFDWLGRQPGEWRMTTFDPHGAKPLNANAPWRYGVQDIRGYESVIPKQYTEFMGAIEPQNSLQFNRVQPIRDWESLNSPLLDLLGARFIITQEQLELPKLKQVWQGDGLRVYENVAAMPRAYVMPASASFIADNPLQTMREIDPRTTVIVENDARSTIGNITKTTPAAPQAAGILTYDNIEVMVETTIGERSWLILNDSYAPGWKAFVRPAGADESAEQEVSIYRVNGNFRGVLLAEAGSWQVRFRYSPPSFILGGLTSFMGMMILLFASVVWGWRRLIPRGIELSATRSIAKNSLAPMALNLFNRAIDFVFAAYYLRLLGPGDAGSYAIAITIASLYEIIANWGLNTWIIREIAADKSQTSRYLFNSSILRLGATVIAIFPVAVYLAGRNSLGNPLPGDTQLALAMLMGGMLFSGLASGITGLFYAYEQAEMPAAIATVTTILKVAFGVAVLLAGRGFVGLAAVSIVVNLITLAIMWFAAQRRIGLPGPWQIDWGLQRQMFVDSYPLMLNHLLATIFFFLDIPILQQSQGDVAVGWYDSAYKYVKAYNIIPSFFTFALFPVISRQIKSSIAEGRRTFRMSIKLLMLVALPLAALTTILAPTMIRALGGSEFLPDGAIALQLIVWSIPFGWINSVTNYVLIALGQERMQTRAFAIGVAFNLIANWIFIPIYSYRAAAVTTILSEIVLLAIFIYYLRPQMPDVGWIAILWRPMAITGLMGMGGWLAYRGGGWLIGGATAILLYGMGWGLLGVFGEDERRILATLLPASVAQRLGINS